MSDCTQTQTVGYYTQLLEKRVNDEKLSNGLVDIRIFPASGDFVTKEFIARDVLAIHDAFLAGDTTKVTGPL